MNKRQVRRGFEQVGRKIHISRGGLNFRRRRRKIQGEKVRYVSLWAIQIFAVVLLAFFAAGAVLGVLSVLGIIYRQRREVVRLKREMVKVVEPAKPLSTPNV